ncbi:hypothetical protein [Variovorax sp.]|jgi:hypothetical protein|uniref:hypothetical protein n=1 Tax=Variovorax sp. TaxID=1871043 RepID=UPI0037D9ECB8
MDEFFDGFDSMIGSGPLNGAAVENSNVPGTWAGGAAYTKTATGLSGAGIAYIGAQVAWSGVPTFVALQCEFKATGSTARAQVRSSLYRPGVGNTLRILIEWRNNAQTFYVVTQGDVGLDFHVLATTTVSSLDFVRARVEVVPQSSAYRVLINDVQVASGIVDADLDISPQSIFRDIDAISDGDGVAQIRNFRYSVNVETPPVDTPQFWVSASGAYEVP